MQSADVQVIFLTEPNLCHLLVFFFDRTNQRKRQANGIGYLYRLLMEKIGLMEYINLLEW